MPTPFPPCSRFIFFGTLAFIASLTHLPARAAEFLRSPGMVSVYSFVIPGTGQLVNGDLVAGFGQYAAASVLATRMQSEAIKPDYLGNQSTYTDSRGDRYTRTNATTFSYDTAIRLFTNLSLYSSYAAMRDRYRQLGITKLGHGVPAPQNDLQQLALAPFKWSIVSKTEVWVPLAISLIGVSAGKGDYRVDAGGLNKNQYTGGMIASSAYTTAIGEEAFFRGIGNTQMSAAWGPNWGLAGSAVFFGIAHNGQNGSATALQAAATGGYMAWVQQKNNYDLQATTALHFWWNTIALLSIIADSKNFNSGSVAVSWGIPF